MAIMWGYLCKNKIYDCAHQVESTVDSGLCDFKLKFRFSEKAPIFENDIPIFLALLINVKKLDFFQDLLAVSEFLNFTEKFRANCLLSYS